MVMASNRDPGALPDGLGQIKAEVWGASMWPTKWQGTCRIVCEDVAYKRGFVVKAVLHL